jgi:hypothetical protein
VCETFNTLITRGPYNQAFRRRATEGFAIDVKLQLRTLAANGLIGVKDASAYGDGLLFLYLRHGIGGRAKVTLLKSSEKDHRNLGCYDVLEGFDTTKLHPLCKHYTLSTNY